MIHKNLKEFVASIVLILLLVAFLDPFRGSMPSGMQMMEMLALIIVFAVFAAFVWKERSHDERESYHKLLAGRDAFLVGSAFLVLAIIVQSLAHQVDDWLVVALGAMILAKLIGIVRAEEKH